MRVKFRYLGHKKQTLQLFNGTKYFKKSGIFFQFSVAFSEYPGIWTLTQNAIQFMIYSPLSINTKVEAGAWKNSSNRKRWEITKCILFFSLNASGISEANASTSTLNTSNANNTGISEIMELAQRNPQELHEITSLIAELMPPLPVSLWKNI